MASVSVMYEIMGNDFDTHLSELGAYMIHVISLNSLNKRLL